MNRNAIKLADLCARLPYGVKVDIEGGTHTLDSICDDDGFYFNILDPDRPAFWEGYKLDEIKAYLFPMSSMTEEQYKIYWDLEHSGDMEHLSIPALDWLNANHFDYRGLIDSGDALDATNLGIYKI